MSKGFIAFVIIPVIFVVFALYFYRRIQKQRRCTARSRIAIQHATYPVVPTTAIATSAPVLEPSSLPYPLHGVPYPTQSYPGAPHMPPYASALPPSYLAAPPPPAHPDSRFVSIDLGGDHHPTPGGPPGGPPRGAPRPGADEPPPPYEEAVKAKKPTSE